MAAPPSQRPDTGRVLGQEEAMAQALIEMMDIQGDKTRTLSDLNEEEIGTLALLQTLGNRVKVDEINDFVRLFCQFKVSRMRMGRREIVSAISLGTLGMEDRRKRGSIKDLFGGGR